MPASTPLRNLSRLLAAWLAAILLLQGIVAAQAKVLGPLHHHAPESGVERSAGHDALFRHATEPLHFHGHDERHHHAHDERHHHDHDDDSVVLSGADPALEGTLSASAALAAAFVALLSGRDVSFGIGTRHVWRAFAGWTASPHIPVIPERPPRG